MPQPQPARSPDFPVEHPVTPDGIRRAKRRHASSEESQLNVLKRYEEEGFTGQFGTRAGGKVMCFSCREESPAARIKVHAMHRLEGSSDPADEMLVAAVTCPACGVKGTLSLSYGAGSTAEDGLVLKALDDRLHEGTLRAGV